MNTEDAKMQALIWWGEFGSAALVPFWKHSKYVVGITTLPSRLGGHVSKVYGASWKSFEDAFAQAVANGYEPVTGFEGDDALVDEA